MCLPRAPPFWRTPLGAILPRLSTSPHCLGTFLLPFAVPLWPAPPLHPLWVGPELSSHRPRDRPRAPGRLSPLFLCSCPVPWAPSPRVPWDVSTATRNSPFPKRDSCREASSPGRELDGVLSLGILVPPPRSSIGAPPLFHLLKAFCWTPSSAWRASPSRPVLPDLFHHPAFCSSRSPGRPLPGSSGLQAGFESSFKTLPRCTCSGKLS